MDEEVRPVTNDPTTISIEDVVRDLRIVRARYIMPDTSAYVRYLPRFDPNPEDIAVHLDPHTESHVEAEKTGEFTVKDLVNELRFAYVQIHLFASRDARNAFVSGFDDALYQLQFIGGNYDFNRLWISSGTSNLGIPVAIFLGLRAAVNGQPSVSLIEHRDNPRGIMRYRAVRGAGDHVGEEFFEAE